MSSNSIILYVKTGCPWCQMAEQYLNKRGFRYERFNVRLDRAAFDELKSISGQTSTPTLVVGDHLLADFGPEALEEFLKEHNILP